MDVILELEATAAENLEAMSGLLDLLSFLERSKARPPPAGPPSGAAPPLLWHGASPMYAVA
jgi:hypothetical protein